MDSTREIYSTVPHVSVHSMMGEVESAWLAGFRYAFKKASLSVSRSLPDAANELEKLGKRK